MGLGRDPDLGLDRMVLVPNISVLKGPLLALRHKVHTLAPRAPPRRTPRKKSFALTGRLPYRAPVRLRIWQADSGRRVLLAALPVLTAIARKVLRSEVPRFETRLPLSTMLPCSVRSRKHLVAGEARPARIGRDWCR